MRVMSQSYAVAARQREIERRWSAAVAAVCALALLAALVYGAAVKARRSLADVPAACRAEAQPGDYPDAWVEGDFYLSHGETGPEIN